MTSAQDGKYEVLWPRSPRQSQNRTLARRTPSLSGKRIGFLWDYLFRGDEVFAMLQDAIGERFPDTEFVSWKEFGNTYGSDERKILANLPARLRELGVDAVVSGMAA